MFGDALVIGIVIALTGVALAAAIGVLLFRRRRSDGRQGPTPPPVTDGPVTDGPVTDGPISDEK